MENEEMAIRGKAANAARAKKIGAEVARQRATYNTETQERHTAADFELVLEKARVGRPSTLPPTKRVIVALTAAQVETASRLGDGNVSAGIRRALEKNLDKSPRPC